MTASIVPSENGAPTYIGAKFGRNAVPSLLIAIDKTAGNPYPVTLDHTTGALSVVDTAAEASLAQIHTDAGTTLHADLGSANTKLDTLHTDLGTTIHGDLGVSGQIHADLGQLHTDLGVIEAALISPAGGGHPNVVSVNNAITALVTARPLRAALLIQNQDATNAVGVSTAAGATFAQCPIILAAGQGLGLTIVSGSALAWYAITGASTVNVGITEMY